MVRSKLHVVVPGLQIGCISPLAMFQPRPKVDDRGVRLRSHTPGPQMPRSRRCNCDKVNHHRGRILRMPQPPVCLLRLKSVAPSHEVPCAVARNRSPRPGSLVSISDMAQRRIDQVCSVSPRAHRLHPIPNNTKHPMIKRAFSSLVQSPWLRYGTGLNLRIDTVTQKIA